MITSQKRLTILIRRLVADHNNVFNWFCDALRMSQGNKFSPSEF